MSCCQMYCYNYIRLFTNIEQYGMSLVNNVPTSEEGMRKVSLSNT